jgi:hypothetical protein
MQSQLLFSLQIARGFQVRFGCGPGGLSCGDTVVGLQVTELVDGIQESFSATAAVLTPHQLS